MAWSLPEGAVLGLFGKRPEPGMVKTRLAVEFGQDMASNIHEAMLLDLLDLWGSDRVLAPGGRRVLAYDPPESGPWFDQRVPRSFALRPQVEGDLGARMRDFFEAEFECGATRVVLIGSDAPALDPSIIVSAFLCLEGRDVVIGPSADGGYYLVGCRNEVPTIFDGIAWSTSRVLSETIDRLNGSGQTLAVLPPGYDVDTPDDLRALSGHLRALRRAGVSPGLPRTEAILEVAFPRG